MPTLKNSQHSHHLLPGFGPEPEGSSGTADRKQSRHSYQRSQSLSLSPQVDQSKSRRRSHRRYKRVIRRHGLDSSSTVKSPSSTVGPSSPPDYDWLSKGAELDIKFGPRQQTPDLDDFSAIEQSSAPEDTTSNKTAAPASLRTIETLATAILTSSAETTDSTNSLSTCETPAAPSSSLTSTAAASASPSPTIKTLATRHGSSHRSLRGVALSTPPKRMKPCAQPSLHPSDCMRVCSKCRKSCREAMMYIASSGAVDVSAQRPFMTPSLSPGESNRSCGYIRKVFTSICQWAGTSDAPVLVARLRRRPACPSQRPCQIHEFIEEMIRSTLDMPPPYSE